MNGTVEAVLAESAARHPLRTALVAGGEPIAYRDLWQQARRYAAALAARGEDMVLRGGFNVYPREVEEVLCRHPSVAQVAVIGVPHSVHGEEDALPLGPSGKVLKRELVKRFSL